MTTNKKRIIIIDEKKKLITIDGKEYKIKHQNNTDCVDCGLEAQQYLCDKGWTTFVFGSYD